MLPVLKPRFGLVGLVFCLLALPRAATADISSIYASNNAAWAAGGASLLNYKESVTPLPNSQHGWLPSFSAGAGYIGQNGLYLAADGSLSDGNDVYHGSYQSSPSVPIQATTHQTIASVAGKVGLAFVLSHSLLLTPYVDLGYRFWRRELQADQIERYHHFEALAGALVQVSPVDRLVLSLYGASGGTFGGRMKTDGDTFNLGSAAVYKAGAKAGFGITQRLEILTSMDFNHFRYVKSGLVNGSFEPSSGTNETALRVGLSYHFL